ncbi:hypothetical protein GNIT_1571 [Glaciecola nitratireducens FR1064]|uniref:Uncharacterized protein n=1 Tax=Glaciecola nitratireducens (strain JCM 12485 / KCTC 12276 / FR1064) TaxID=1085623 RepID=G4QGQ2_GLANF|nr:hypothetical protein GNIT_1571 [Glaciecola nitratireducens FR1064]
MLMLLIHAEDEKDRQLIQNFSDELNQLYCVIDDTLSIILASLK